ncbi:MAG: hypothetical protein ACLFM1_00540 [Bacteroidales bacterium]
MNKENEISIVELYGRLYLFLKRRILIIAVGVVAGLIAGTVHYSFLKPGYKYKLLINSDFVNQSVLYQPLFPMLNESNVINEASFKEYFSIDQSEIEFTKSIYVDTLSFPNAVTLEFVLADTSQVRVLKNVMLDYYDGNEKINRMIEDQQAQASSYHNLLEQELNEINEFQKEVMQQKGDESVSPSGLASIAGSYDEVVMMMDKIQELEELLNNSQGLSFEWSSNYVKRNISLVKYLVIYGFLFLIIGIIFAFWVDLHKKALSQLKSNTR